MVFKKKGSFFIFAAFSIFIFALAAVFIDTTVHDLTTNRDMRLDNSSFLLGQWIIESFKSSESYLLNIINHVPLDDIHYPPKNNTQYYSYTREINKISSTLPHVLFAGIIDNNGILSHSSSVDGFDLSDKPFFIEMVNNPERKSIISNAYKSPEGYYQIAQGLNYKTDSSEFQAMAVITVGLDFFSKWIEKLEDNNAAIITIIDENGLVLAQNSNDNTVIGRPYSTLSLNTITDSNHEYQLLLQNSPTHDYEHIFAVRKLSTLPFYVIIEEVNTLRSSFLFSYIMTAIALIIIHFLAIIVLNSHLSYMKINSELEQTTHEMKTIFNHSMVGIILLNGDRKIIRANQRFADMAGADSPESLEGKNISDFHSSKKSYAESTKFYTEDFMKNGIVDLENEFVRLNGRKIWVRVIGKTIDQNIPPDLDKGIIWIIDDITEHREAKKKLIEMATKDQLTGLCNRHYFMELGNRELSIFERTKRPVSILMIDIDHFKLVNDTYGHGVGDKALANFANICRQSIRTQDIAGRIGGEEFAVILPDTELNMAHQVAERIRTKTEESTTDNPEGLPFMTVSIGIAEVAPPSDLSKTLQSADTALYEAKNSGRNKVVIFSADKKDE